MIEEHKILAFHERELETILSKLKLLEKIQKGEIKCAFCGKSITQENFGALLKRSNNILVICDDPSCIEKARSD